VADIASTYTLVTPGGTIYFNNGATNEYFLTDTPGLDQAAVRNPTDLAPQTSGFIVHNRFEEGMRFQMVGILMIRSSRVGTAVRTARNSMESALTTALRSILSADGTLSWTPLGGSAQSLTVRQDIKVEYAYIDNYLNKTFSFGLVSEAATG
jgi:hypothetical protein